MQRLDKYLSDAKAGSRKEIRELIRRGAVYVNGVAAASPEQKIDETAPRVTVNGIPIEGMRPAIVMLYKPAGYVTSTDDPRDKTVMELLPEKYRKLGVVPVGRLDKETEGLLLLTNDGALAHRLISPRYAVEKEYYAEHTGSVSDEDVAAFRNGLTLKDGTVCRPALLESLGEGKSRITVTEGKYHQVRRMMASRNLRVTYLRREREGNLTLSGLSVGMLREILPQALTILDD